MKIETLTTDRNNARSFSGIAVAKRYADKMCTNVSGCHAVVLAGKNITIEMNFGGVKHYFA